MATSRSKVLQVHEREKTKIFFNNVDYEKTNLKGFAGHMTIYGRLKIIESRHMAQRRDPHCFVKR